MSFHESRQIEWLFHHSVLNQTNSIWTTLSDPQTPLLRICIYQVIKNVVQRHITYSVHCSMKYTLEKHTPFNRHFNLKNVQLKLFKAEAQKIVCLLFLYLVNTINIYKSLQMFSCNLFTQNFFSLEHQSYKYKFLLVQIFQGT